MDGIKLTTSGGVLSIGDKNVCATTPATRSGRLGTRRTRSACSSPPTQHSEDGIRVAVEEGVDSIEHGTLMSRDLAETLAARRTPVAPTLLINEAIAQGRVPVTAEAMAKAAELVATRDVLLAQAAALGVRFVLGTDANGHHVQFGDQLAEVVHMTRILGWTPSRRCARPPPTRPTRSACPWAASPSGWAPTWSCCAAARGNASRTWPRRNIVAVVSRGRLVAGRLP
ncbi:hypothetical protein GCM10020220_073460 [Nonomuraea rubra]